MSKQVILPAIVAVVVIGIGTVMQGKYSERWTTMTSEVLDNFTACVERFPRVLGDWEGKDDPPISDEVWEKTNCTAYISRNYRNKKTGAEVSCYLVSGTAKHITIHSPDWCYVGAGFTLQGEIQDHTVKLPSGSDMEDPEFATAVFIKEEGMTSGGLRIFWTYSDDGVWKGPTSSNWAKASYGGRPAMYKIYLVAQPVAANESPCNDFVRDLFPRINENLVSVRARCTNHRWGAAFVIRSGVVIKHLALHDPVAKLAESFGALRSTRRSVAKLVNVVWDHRTERIVVRHQKHDIHDGRDNHPLLHPERRHFDWICAGGILTDQRTQRPDSFRGVSVGPAPALWRHPHRVDPGGMLTDQLTEPHNSHHFVSVGLALAQRRHPHWVDPGGMLTDQLTEPHNSHHFVSVGLALAQRRHPHRVDPGGMLTGQLHRTAQFTSLRLRRACPGERRHPHRVDPGGMQTDQLTQPRNSHRFVSVGPVPAQRRHPRRVDPGGMQTDQLTQRPSSHRLVSVGPAPAQRRHLRRVDPGGMLTDQLTQPRNSIASSPSGLSRRSGDIPVGLNPAGCRLIS